MNEKLEKMLALFLVIIYSGWVMYLINKDYSFFFDASLLIMAVFVWYKAIRILV